MERDYVFEFDQDFEEYFISMPDGIEINALLFKTQQPSKGLIIYFHGNADNLQRWGEYAADLTPFGYQVLMVEYRGYGKSEGKPGEKEFYSDAETVLKWATKNIPYNRLVLYGRSLGSAVASNLAVNSQPDLLILETPFDELRGVVYPIFKPVLSFFPGRYTFSNKENLSKIKCEVLILHGTEDWVVPMSSAVQLKPFMKETDDFVIIEGGGHNDLKEYKDFHEALAMVLQD